MFIFNLTKMSFMPFKAPVQSKLHEIASRKKMNTKSPVNIDYVTALETVIEKNAKVKVTYVFNRINRLPADAQSSFLQGFQVPLFHFI